MKGSKADIIFCPKDKLGLDKNHMKHMNYNFTSYKDIYKLLIDNTHTKNICNEILIMNVNKYKLQNCRQSHGNVSLTRIEKNSPTFPSCTTCWPWCSVKPKYIASNDRIVPNMDPNVPNMAILEFLMISALVIPWSQKQMVCSVGGKTRARAAAAVEPIREMKLSS